MNYAELSSDKSIPQTESLNDRQVANNGGGFAFTVDRWTRLERFLILGSDKPTYYQSAQKLTRENAAVVVECWNEDPARTAEIVMNVSRAGRAPKNDPAIFALVLGAISGNLQARQMALSPMTINVVCRTGTHIMQFVSLAKQMGKGFGRAMKRAVASWYNDKDVDAVAYQVVKYRSRHGFTHGRLLDMARPNPADYEDRNDLYAWIVGKSVESPVYPKIVVDHERAMKLEEKDVRELLQIIAENPSLPWEALPTWANADPAVQKALLPNMGMTALVRNLGNLTRIGAIGVMSNEELLVTNRLKSLDDVRKSKIHPLQMLVALKVYASGRSATAGKFGGEVNRWHPNANIVAALQMAFYHSFVNAPKTGKRHFIAIDVSGSMGAAMSGSEHVSCAEAAAALAMTIARSEDMTYVTRFNNRLEPVTFNKESALGDILRQTVSINMGGTDCALPMIVAADGNIPADVFVIITDNETNARTMHPMVALSRYRQKTGINAKLIVIGMTSTGFSIADPDDGGCLDVVGFDAGAPAVIADFVR